MYKVKKCEKKKKKERNKEIYNEREGKRGTYEFKKKKIRFNKIF